jgi:hypothetical protein
MLLGRRRECEALDRLLRMTRAGHGGTILVLGEAGIGKTALLGYVVSAAEGFQVRRAVGKEAEKELPFAALQQLCAPGMAGIDQPPSPQRPTAPPAAVLTKDFLDAKSRTAAS